MIYKHDIAKVAKIVNQIIAGDLLKVERWEYYMSRRVINEELKKLGLFSKASNHLLSLEDSVKETL